LKYVKASVDKQNKFRKIKLKIFERAYFDNFFYFVDLRRHMSLSEIILVMLVH